MTSWGPVGCRGCFMSFVRQLARCPAPAASQSAFHAERAAQLQTTHSTTGVPSLGRRIGARLVIFSSHLFQLSSQCQPLVGAQSAAGRPLRGCGGQSMRLAIGGASEESARRSLSKWASASTLAEPGHAPSLPEQVPSDSFLP
ncbi:unnamed protein product [Symbiodinium natans]|uniref:Uncharacterized protein n=1 Tax=Symbiodinium natans TaxID=878477 RepID=A0A812TQZ1_9DINO|nr:unnamed protein product [Symbiodinium natans]